MSLGNDDVLEEEEEEEEGDVAEEGFLGRGGKLGGF